MRRLHRCSTALAARPLRMGIIASTLGRLLRMHEPARGAQAELVEIPSETPYGNPLPDVLHLELQEAQLKPGRLIVVGDVHGCCDELELLLERCGAGEQDNIVLVGDLVNKGPKSAQVLDLVRARGCWAVRGNHDEAALQSHRLWQQRQPIKERWAWVQQLQPRQLELLRGLPFTLLIPAYGLIVVHAGLVPGVPLQQQRLADMVLMRDVAAAGGGAGASSSSTSTSDNSSLQGLERAQEGSSAWAANWPGPQHVLFGHDAKRKLQQQPHATGLDTGCVYGFKLTAAVLPPLQQLRQSEAFCRKLAAGEPLLLADLQGELVAVDALAQHEAPKAKKAAAAAAAAAAGEAGGAAAEMGAAGGEAAAARSEGAGAGGGAVQQDGSAAVAAAAAADAK